ncbi:E3 binding domain-containing protein, partial [Myxococcota bacterium]|nr:E3 binding domain-containing protein [Myxococcota bacterium]
MFDLKVPTIGESITSAFVGTWLKKPGQAVAEGEAVVSLDSDKASLEVPSPVAGVLRELLAQEGDEVEIGAVIARIEEGAVAAAAPPSPAAAGAAPSAVPAAEAPRAATPSDKGPQTGPAARAVAAEVGVDLRQVEGTGVRGRVLSRDGAA